MRALHLGGGFGSIPPRVLALAFFRGLGGALPSALTWFINLPKASVYFLTFSLTV